MEIQKAEKIARRLDTISKLLLISLIIFAVSHYLLSVFVIDPLGIRQPLSCFGFDFTTFLNQIVALLFFVLPILAIFFSFATLFFVKIKKVKITHPALGINLWGLLILGIFVCLFMSMTMVSMCGCGSRYKARDAKRMSDLRYLAELQEKYYQKYSRYAATQQELVDGGLLSSLFIDPLDGKAYTNASGNGISGVNNDPQKWSVQAGLEGNKPFAKEICDKSRSTPVPSSYYACSDQGCSKIDH